ncbi:MAG: OmpP1/FadL family transporter [Rhodothalassiaceae bacterium]
MGSRLAVAILAYFFLCLPKAQAQPLGSELDLNLTPVNGGMAGVGTARGFDLMARLFGNPATLVQTDANTEFLLGAAYVSPDLDVEGTVPTPGGLLPIQGSSTTRTLLLPNAGVSQKLTDRLVVGFGFTGVSGLGSDSRDTLPQPFGLTADLKIFGAAMTAAYQVTDDLAVGATFLGGIGSLNVGTISSTAVVNDFGFAGIFGFTYDFGPVIFGANYKTKLRITYDLVVRPAPNELADFTLTQPASVMAGFATTPDLFERLTIGVDARYKGYSNASGYQAFWRDQWSVAIGANYEAFDGLFVRLGFGANRGIAVPREDLGNSFGSLTTLFAPGFPDVGAGPDTAPVSPDLLQLVQSTIANGLWTRGVTGGFGYELTEEIRFDLNLLYGFRGEETFVSDTSPQVLNPNGQIFAVGFGFTWRIGQ